MDKICESHHWGGGLQEAAHLVNNSLGATLEVIFPLPRAFKETSPIVGDPYAEIR
jgi:hypothetical protein